MPTTAKKTFNVNIKRASYFLDIHAATQPGVGAPDLARRELPRGALVFAIGALDAYLSEVSAEVMISQLQSEGDHSELRSALKQVQSSIPTLSLEVALISGQSNRIDYVRAAILDHFHRDVSTLGAKAVSAAVQRIGVRTSDFWSEIGQAYNDAPKQIDDWTDVRHRIVHRGEKPRVWRPHARDFIELVSHLVAVVDKYATRSIKGAAA